MNADRKISKNDLGKTFIFFNAKYHESFSGTITAIERREVAINLGSRVGLFEKSGLVICQQIAKDCEPCAHGDCSFHMAD